MKIVKYTVQGLGSVTIREQAVNAAKARAARTGGAVIVTAHIDDGRIRKVQYNPDGSVVQLWKEES